MQALFNRFTIEMTKAQASSASHQGDCEQDVNTLLRDAKIRRMLAKIPADSIRAELKEYGAWNEKELANDADNKQRIIWIAAGNITEERG